MKVSKYPKWVEYELHRYTSSKSLIINAFVVSRTSIEGYSGCEVDLPKVNYSEDELEITTTNETIPKDEILLLTKDIVIFRGSIYRFPTDIDKILDRDINYTKKLADKNYRYTVQRINEDKRMKDKIQTLLDNSELRSEYQSLFIYLLRKTHIKNKLINIHSVIENNEISNKIADVISECEIDYK